VQPSSVPAAGDEHVDALGTESPRGCEAKPATAGALPRAGARRACRHGGVPTGRHDVDRSARDASRPPRSSFATDGRSCAGDKVAKLLADPGVRSPRLVLEGSRLPAVGAARRSVGARITACGRLLQQAWRSKRARWLLSAICSDDGCSSYDRGSQFISASRARREHMVPVSTG
jgi:hypothetical protein